VIRLIITGITFTQNYSFSPTKERRTKVHTLILFFSFFMNDGFIFYITRTLPERSNVHVNFSGFHKETKNAKCKGQLTFIKRYRDTRLGEECLPFKPTFT
jgi:hypothetical protein